jgi:hypothetical protein
MNVVVFVGPTLAAEDARALLPAATILEPVASGDVARVARERPDAIGIVDGYFDQRLAVWHKEILWALSQGVRVYGGGSLGALRAAELAEFGMVGVGRVFDWFHSGALEDDDEVAVVHEMADRGFRARSDAMVNIRATLEGAVEAGVISLGTERQLIAIGKSFFFAQRSFPAILSRAQKCAIDEIELARLKAWLRQPSNIVDQKRLDAQALLCRMNDDLAEERESEPPGFAFQYTEAWHELARSIASSDEPEAQVTAVSPARPVSQSFEDPMVEGLFAAAGRRGDAFRDHLWREAVERAFAVHLSRGLAIDQVAVQTVADAFRRKNDLFTPADTSAWLERQGMDIGDFSTLMHEEALVGMVRGVYEGAVRAQIPNVLRLRGEIDRLSVDASKPKP